MRWTIPFLPLAALWIASVSSAAEAAPNIVLILTDDQGWSQVALAMDPRVAASRSTYLETPNMTRLAREGLRLTNAYAAAPLCSPSRRSILSGSSAARSGGEIESRWIPAEHLTIPRALERANANYRSAHLGKWGESMNSTPKESGYDVSDGPTSNDSGGMPATLGVASGEHEDGPPHFIDDDDPKRTRSVTDRAIAFAREQALAKRPFYLQVSYYAVHLSVVSQKSTWEKYERKGPPDRGYTPAWAAMLEELDVGIGRLMSALEELGIEDDTYVFLTSDNGGRESIPGGDPNRLDPNYPLTGGKHTLHEGGIRVPLLVRGPGIEPDSVDHTPVVAYDFLSTFYDLAGGRDALPPEVDGVSFRPLLGDPGAAQLDRPTDALFFHLPARNASAIRRGDYKLLLSWKRNGRFGKSQLYRVDPDPREAERNLARREPLKAHALRAALLSHLHSVGAQKAGASRRKRGKR